MSKITYVDKETAQTSTFPEKNKATAANYNEIKSVVNNNDDELQALNIKNIEAFPSAETDEDKILFPSGGGVNWKTIPYAFKVTSYGSTGTEDVTTFVYSLSVNGTHALPEASTTTANYQPYVENVSKDSAITLTVLPSGADTVTGEAVIPAGRSAYITRVNATTYNVTQNNSTNLIDFEPQASAPAYKEGRVWYDNVRETLNFYNGISDVTVNLPEETLIPVWNATGVTITNGQVLKSANAATGGVSNVALAQADSGANSRVVGVATHDIENNSKGYITLIGSIGGFDTSSYSPGDTLFLSATTAGGFENVEQKYLTPVALVLTSDVSGTIYVFPRGTINLTAVAQSLGAAAETQALTTTPAKCYGYALNSASQPEINVTVNQVVNPGVGTGYSSDMTPSSAGATGFYDARFSVAIESTSNNLITFYVYKNGVATGIESTIDMRNPSIDAGSTSFVGVIPGEISNTDTIEIYVASDAGTPTITFNSCALSINRLGNV